MNFLTVLVTYRIRLKTFSRLFCLKNAAHQAYVTEISGHKNRIKLTMWKDAEVDVERIPILVREYKGRLKFMPKDEPYFIFQPKPGTGTVIENARKLVESLSTLKDEE